MRAVAVFPKEKKLKVIDHPEPQLRDDNDVMLRVLDVGLCGTDREIAAFEYGEPPEGSDYLIIGHECLAEVTDLGKAVTKVKKGDLVVPRVRRPCSHPDCKPCRMGRPDFCLTGDFTERGINKRHGYMTEKVTVHEEFLHVLPPRLRKIGVLVEPLTIAQKALVELGNIEDRLPYCEESPKGQVNGKGLNALVLGAGPVGMLGAFSLLKRGFKTYVYSLNPEPNKPAELIEKAGGQYVSSKQVDLKALAAMIGNIDVVYEAVGASQFAFEVLGALGTNGIFIFTGVPGRKGPLPINTDQLMRNMVLKNQLLYGTVNAGPQAFENAIHDLEYFHKTWPDVIGSIITRQVPMEKVGDDLTHPKDGIKNIVNVAGQ